MGDNWPTTIQFCVLVAGIVIYGYIKHRWPLPRNKEEDDE